MFLYHFFDSDSRFEVFEKEWATEKEGIDIEIKD